MCSPLPGAKEHLFYGPWAPCQSTMPTPRLSSHSMHQYVISQQPHIPDKTTTKLGNHAELCTSLHSLHENFNPRLGDTVKLPDEAGLRSDLVDWEGIGLMCSSFLGFSLSGSVELSYLILSRAANELI